VRVRELRDYQAEAVDAVESAWGEGMLRVGIVLPTGTGKTDIIARIATDAASAGKRTLVVAHRGELLDQITQRCTMHAPGIAVGRVQAERNQARRPITVAMAPTLASERRRSKLSRPDVVIVDEAHHAASPSQMAILRWAGSFDHTPTMGVTATMVRGDRRGLGDVWQEVVYERSISWAVDAGWLVRPRGRAVVVDHLDLERAKISKGDYQDNELGGMVSQDVDQIVKAWWDHASDRITIAFTPNVASAEALALEFESAGVPCEAVLGTTSLAQRRETYARLAAGRTRVLVSVMVTTEGFDCPPVSCILMARPTRLAGLYTQIVGRGLRTSPGKRDCLVLDVVGASRHQRLVTLTDLHSSAEYDTDELDALPCERCQVAPCACLPAQRDPDGGRARLLGPADYEDLDLFATSALNWLFTRSGIRFLPAGERMAALLPVGDEYRPGHCSVKGYSGGVYVGRDGVALGPAMGLHAAREIAESWAIAFDSGVTTRASGWRRGSKVASDAQVSYAARLGVPAPETMNKARLSDEISIALATRVLG